VSIQRRLTIYWAIITAAILTVTGALIVVMFSRQSLGTLDATLLEEADTTAAALSQAGAEDAPPILRHLSQERDLAPGRRVRLLLAGQVAFDHGDAHTVMVTNPAGHGRGIVATEDGRYRVAVVPFRLAGKPAWLEDGVDAQALAATVARLRQTLMLLIPLVFLLCVAGGYWLSRRALRPLVEITAELGSIGPRDLRRRLTGPAVKDEAGLLIEAINKLLARLEQAAAAQKRFVSEAAHELRTPLTILRSGLEVSLQRPRSAEESRHALERALAETQRLSQMAAELLTLARLDAESAHEEAPIDLATLAREAVDTVSTLAEAKHQSLRFEAAPHVMVRANSREMRRMLLNLLDNAIKFTPTGGVIETAVVRDNGHALLAVRDSGPGIAAKELDRIFDPFYTGLGVTGGGSGLGLALCREIVRLHNGSIEARNRPGGGCEVEARLPAAPEN
jgi:two-component system OmpR family sensor kinase